MTIVTWTEVQTESTGTNMEKQLFWICVLQASLLVFCQDTDKTESVQNSESTSTEDTKSQVLAQFILRVDQ